MNHEEFNILLQAYANDAMTQEQWERFREAVQGGAFDAVLEADFAAYLKSETIHGSWNEIKLQNSWRVIGERTGALLEASPSTPPVHRVHFLKTTWFRYAAAILLLVTVVGLYYSVFHTPQPGTKVVQNTPPSVPARDILPGSERAVLTLSDGSKVELNNATSETINDGTLSIKNTNGQLVYGYERGNLSSAGGGGRGAAGGGSREARTATNTMSTPRGGQYKLTLSDGTNVWLNAASSITYPTAFTGKTREVSVTGEAYFEVTKNKEKPFIVTVAGSYPPSEGVARSAGDGPQTAGYRIEVLGTSFNVNAYPDEPSMKTSLLEGSIKIGDTFIKPGQAYKDGKVNNTDVSRDISWKNGYFNFNDQNLVQVMRQLSRWYDIEVVYENEAPKMEFVGRMSRNLKLSKVLEFLKGSGLKFRMEGNRLIVTK